MKLKKFKARLGDGLWLGVPAETYHKHPGCLSSTGVRTLLESPLTYHREATGLIRREPTDAMTYGTVAHSAILEQRFDTFHIQPAHCVDGSDWHNSKKECKTWNEAHADKPVLSAKQAAELSEASNYIRNHPKAGRLLKGGHAEVSAIAAGNKARFDYLILDGDSAKIVDLKTCADASTAAFGKEIMNRGYHIQAAWYRRVLQLLGAKTVQFFFVALQKGPLPLVNVWELTTPAMDLGAMECNRAMDLKLKCETNKEWPEWSDYDGSNEVKTIDVPAWAYPEPELTGAEELP